VVIAVSVGKDRPSQEEVERQETVEAQQAAAPAETPADNAAETSSLADLQRAVEELRDQNLRLIAETRNLQQRAARDKAEAVRHAAGDFARDLLVIIDDLERTLDSARSATQVETVADGVRIVYEHFLKILADRHITQIDAEGRPFDPDLHEAVLQQPSDEHPAGTVIQELARGYRMHDRVLRYSRVIVSSGPVAKTDSGPAADEE
jgi:molecular chaperone GrpE